MAVIVKEPVGGIRRRTVNFRRKKHPKSPRKCFFRRKRAQKKSLKQKKLYQNPLISKTRVMAKNVKSDNIYAEN